MLGVLRDFTSCALCGTVENEENVFCFFTFLINFPHVSWEGKGGLIFFSDLRVIYKTSFMPHDPVALSRHTSAPVSEHMMAETGVSCGVICGYKLKHYNLQRV